VAFLVRAWNPSLHPRGPDGRFTKSFARKADGKGKKRIAAARGRFKARPPFRSPQDAAGFLGGLSTNKTRGPGQMDRYLAQMRAANQALRSGDPDPSGLQAAMKPTTEDVTVYRSVPLSEFGSAAPQDLQGFVVRDAGFFPASAAPTVAQPGEVRMTIDVPAGTNAAGSPDTSELILDAGTEMSVDEVTTTPDGSAEMHLTALPAEGAPSADQSDTEADSPEPAGNVGDVLDSMPALLQNDEAGRDWQRRAVEQMGAAMNGTFAGMNVEVTGATPFMGGPEGEDRGVSVRLRITDADGNEVGSASRAVYRDENGNLAAVHEELVLDPEVRGNGFAAEFNRNLTDWYRSQGVERIELTANIDVGGYAWASHGYDFADEDSAQRIANRLMEHIDSAPPEVQKQARELLKRFDRPFGSEGFPTPFEISRLGRDPGAASWLGKDVLLNSAWEGVKWL
jgi:hypothetical protein